MATSSLFVIRWPRTETGNRMYCPRCETTLSVSYEESLCMVCGYADYDYVSPNAKNGHQSMISSGTRYVLRYVGDFPSLADTLTHVKLKRLRNRVVYGVTCPFCSGAMEQSSLSGKRREMREERVPLHGWPQGIVDTDSQRRPGLEVATFPQADSRRSCDGQ